MEIYTINTRWAYLPGDPKLKLKCIIHLSSIQWEIFRILILIGGTLVTLVRTTKNRPCFFSFLWGYSSASASNKHMVGTSKVGTFTLAIDQSIEWSTLQLTTCKVKRLHVTTHFDI